jgi:hypothetical protein
MLRSGTESLIYVIDLRRAGCFMFAQPAWTIQGDSIDSLYMRACVHVCMDKSKVEH